MNGSPESQMLDVAQSANHIILIGLEKCPKCQQQKNLDDFYKPRLGLRRRPYCKECQKRLAKEYYNLHVDLYRDKQQEWYKNNRSMHNKMGREYRNNNLEKCRASEKKWRLEHPEMCRAGGLRYREKNPEKCRDYAKKKMRRLLSTPRGRINHSLSIQIGQSLCGRKDGGHWETLVGYSVDQLRKHLKKLFLPGMTWDNYGRAGWHIDHIIPKSVFNFNSAEDIDFKRCWTLKNLRPLWAIDNLKKGVKTEHDFQPSFSFFQ